MIYNKERNILQGVKKSTILFFLNLSPAPTLTSAYYNQKIEVQTMLNGEIMLRTTTK